MNRTNRTHHPEYLAVKQSHFMRVSFAPRRWRVRKLFTVLVTLHFNQLGQKKSLRPLKSLFLSVSFTLGRFL